MFFVLAKKDWKEIKAPNPKTTNAYDAYGTSLIAILVDVATGKLLNETLRWNHVIDPSKTNPSATVDKAFKDNYGELSQVVGMDVKAEVDKAVRVKQDELKNKAKHVNEEVDKILKSCGDMITNGTIPKKLCQLLTEVSIPDSVTRIGSYAFDECESLTSIIIPDSVTKIGFAAFFNCKSLKSVSIPDLIPNIGNFTFSNCKSLTSISIPDSVAYIGYSAFYNCESLISISVPNSVTYIGGYAFDGCTSLKSVVFDGKTIEEVKAMDNYPWGIEDESVIKAEKQSKPMRKTARRKPTKKQIKEAIAFWQNVLESLDNANEVK